MWCLFGFCAPACGAGFDHGVLAVCSTSRYWGWRLPGTPPIPAAGMFVQVIEYFQPVFFS